MSCSMNTPAEASLYELCRYSFTAESPVAVPRMARHLCASRVEFGGCCHYQRPPTSFRRLLVQAASRNRRAKSSALLPGSPCPLYATIFHAVTKDRIAGVWLGCNSQDNVSVPSSAGGGCYTRWRKYISSGRAHNRRVLASLSSVC